MRVVPSMFVCITLSLGVTPASANPILPDAYISTQGSVWLYSGGETANETDEGTTSSSVTVTQGGSSVTVTGSATPAPILSISASGIGGQALGIAYMQYYFQFTDVNGGTNVPIPVSILASGSVPDSEFVGNAAQLYLNDPDPILIGWACNQQCGALGEQLSFTTNIVRTLVTDVAYLLQLSLYIGAQSADGSEIVSGFIDPIISIDPSLANPNQFALTLSPGVGNVSAVPLPAALPLLAAAMASFGGFSLWRRRKSQHLPQVAVV